jgi:hypothetical protein
MWEVGSALARFGSDDADAFLGVTAGLELAV